MLRKALLGCLLAIGVLVAVEIALRVTVPKESLLLEWERPTGLVSTTEAGAVVTRPGMHEERQDGPYPWAVRLESLGLREDADVPRARPAGTYRILALGDSWTFGFSVDQGHTIPDVLETLLPARLGVAKVDVLNAGVFGSCAFDMLARYRQLVDTYEVDGILLGQPHNSSRIERIGKQRAAWYGGLREGPASNARLYLLVRRALAPYRASPYAVPPTGDQRQAEIADLRLLAEDARARGLPVWFAELPNDMGHAYGGFSGSPEWREGLGDAGVVFGGHALAERACWGFKDIGHPSESGAAAIATALAEVIATNKTLERTWTEPRCADLPNPGPGKPGWEWQ